MGAKAKAAGGGALALALGLFAVLEGYGPEVKPGVYKSYVDIAGVVTGCNGHTGPDVKLGMTFTKAQCEELATADLGKAFSTQDKYVRQVEQLDPWVRASMALFIANVGPDAFRTSSVRRLLNFKDPSPSVQIRLHHRNAYRVRDVAGACNALLLYNKARVGPGGGLAVVRGLINRRQAERSLCLGEGWEVKK